MHDNRILLCSGKDSVVDAIGILNLQALRLVGEPLLLNSGHIKDISISEDLVQRLAHCDRNACLTSSHNDGGGHGESSWGYEVEANRIKAEQRYKAVDGPAILEIAKESNGASVDCTQFGTDCVDIQEGLKTKLFLLLVIQQK